MPLHPIYRFTPTATTASDTRRDSAMDESLPNAPPPAATRARRPMRKGTHSCTECRRRKIRCTFASNASVCSPCSARGSSCLNQRREPFLHPPSSVAPRQGSAGSSELFLDPAFSDKPDHPSDFDILVNDDSYQPPLVSMIADNEIWSTASETERMSATRPQALGDKSTSNTVPEYGSPQCSSTSQLSQDKAKRVCATLRSALPSYDSFMSTLSEYGSWWASFRFKTHLNSKEPAEELAVFAARNYTSSNPALLGILAAAYARSLNRYHQLYVLIESLVVSDFEYASTIEGMHCLILLARSLTEIGQPRRSWLIWRRGMAIAQLMGLYRGGSNQVLADNIWWVIYSGDRFTSLLLGVPHGFPDGYRNSKTPCHEPAAAEVTLQTMMLAGKIIERNLVAGKPSLAQTLSLDEQLDTIAATLPKTWWTIPDEASSLTPDDQLREKVLQQFYFFHVKTFLHLPFMAKSTGGPTSVISTLACIDASRQMLKRFLLLRSIIQGSYLYECKTTAFLAFTAAVILIIGLGDLSLMSASSSSSEDMGLLMAVKDIFRQIARRDGCKISSQCCNSLDMLMGSPCSDLSTARQGEDQDKILIPYFGIVVRRRTSQTTDRPEHYASQVGYQMHQSEAPSMSQPTTANPLIGNRIQEVELPSFEYSGLGLMGDNVDFDVWTDPSWANSLMMDLDQDWSLFTDFGGM
ncbi:hypothetical protein EDB80DRAFT_740459, partial [Ilyonectria destructans]